MTELQTPEDAGMVLRDGPLLRPGAGATIEVVGKTTSKTTGKAIGRTTGRTTGMTTGRTTGKTNPGLLRESRK
jgi:hypothetical protein